MNTTTLQLNLGLANKEQIRNSWAFAVKQTNFTRNRRRLSDARDSVITSCSKEAKLLGVRAGMRYDDAKTLIPSLRVLVIGGRNV